MEEEICRLCNRNVELRYSHILPEFFYLDTYDELHRTILISRQKERLIQKGIREYLLCQECETKISRHEGYAAKLIERIPNFLRDPSGKFLFSENVDYVQFKLFQLSILWRASISRSFAFAQVNLGPHEETIRCMLNEENPGKSTDYGCVMMTILGTEVIDKILSSPTRIKPKPFGHTVYKFATGNLSWVFFVTSHSVPRQIDELFLQETGLLRIWSSSFDEKTLLINIAKNMQRLEKGR